MIQSGDQREFTPLPAAPSRPRARWWWLAAMYVLLLAVALAAIWWIDRGAMLTNR